jgi:TrmH family RNA methyltransferase
MVSFPVPTTNLDTLIENPPILILEDVRNAENVGSILRTAFCLGITSIIASPIAWSSLRDSRAARCSMGTIYYHRFYKANNLCDTIRSIQKGGIAVYGVEIGDSAKPVRPHGKDRQWAAVMGNEDLGLTKAVGDACDHIVFIPQAHGDSLNVGHAAAITLFELGRDGPIPQHDGRAACT